MSYTPSKQITLENTWNKGGKRKLTFWYFANVASAKARWMQTALESVLSCNGRQCLVKTHADCGCASFPRSHCANCVHVYCRRGFNHNAVGCGAAVSDYNEGYGGATFYFCSYGCGGTIIFTITKGVAVPSPTITKTMVTLPSPTTKPRRKLFASKAKWPLLPGVPMPRLLILRMKDLITAFSGPTPSRGGNGAKGRAEGCCMGGGGERR